MMEEKCPLVPAAAVSFLFRNRVRGQMFSQYYHKGRLAAALNLLDLESSFYPA